jgi:cytochrome b6-f complex iron-sulfur subunit
MSTGAILAIVIPSLVVLAAIVVFAAARRRDLGDAQGVLARETVKRDRGATELTTVAAADEPAIVTGKEVERAAVLARRESDGGALVAAGAPTPVPWTPPDAEQIGVNRRQFFNRSIVGLMGFSLSGFGAACIAFLWPKLGGGFGSDIEVGNIDDIQAAIAAGSGFAYYPEGRMWITEYPVGAIKKAENAYSDAELAGMRAGVIALYQKCPHLGCRVPECVTSQWFECPCHGSQYNRVGEKRAGPAPRGMDRFAMSVSNNVLTVKTGTIIQGPPIGTNTTGQEAEGGHCIGNSDH